MQRPSSSLSNHSVASSAGAGSSLSRRPGTQRPGGPRKPTAKASMPSLTARAQQQQQQQQERSQEQRQSLPPPSYVQSQHDLQRQAPLQAYTPPSSAITSDSRTPSGLVSRAGTPSSLAASSPIRTMSPAPVLHAHPEESSAHQSPQHVSIPLPPSPRPTPEPEAPTSRLSTPSLPSISKPPTPAPDSPTSTTSAYVKPRMTSSVATPTPLQPPPSVDFSSVPIAWKSLTLEAAQWTFSSSELQTIVSRAIRASAEPSSIRLLPLQTLDEELVQESQRLESERAQATAQYRFTMHRRTMLLQSLNASSGSANSPSSFSPSNTINLSSAPTQSPAADLAQRLSEVSATLDRLAQTILRVSDQLSQIRSLQDVHAASALAVALRKLNASYARRTQEVQGLKEKLVAAEEERDEAWRFAEELAMEVDGDGEEYGDVVEGSVVNGERAVAVPATLTRTSRIGMKIRVPGVGPRVRPQDNEDDGPVDEENADIDAAESPSSAPGETVESPAAIPRRRRANSATSRVTAARTRSLRASKASLRFPRSREPRPQSAYSQHSAQSGPSRGRSRANSVVGSPLDAPSPSLANAPGKAIPDVPKIPNEVELARLASVKSTASTTESASLPLPPMPPPPIETSPSKIGSFLDMMTHPNSATDDKGKSPEQSGSANGVAGIGDSVQNPAALKADEAQVNGVTLTDEHSAGNEHHEENDESVVQTHNDVDEAQVITIPPRSQMHHTPFSASHVETRGTALPEAAFARMQLQIRPSLQVYPPTWTRPPPDSPMDVACGSDPHRADTDIQDAEEAELADAFESAYAQTQTGGLAGYTRSPLRMQHTQSMLPFPGTEGRVPFLAGGHTDGASPMLATPKSDNPVAGPFRGAAASASSRRPTSLPSAQAEKPWNYF